MSPWAVSFSALAVAVGGIVLGVRPARACTCAMPAIRVTPRPGDLAPRNTHIWVEVPPALADTLVTLRGPGVGEVELRRYGATAARVIEVVPRAPLDADTLIEVLVGNDVVGEVRVGGATDSTAPTWDGLQSGAVGPGLFAGCGAGQPFVVLGLGKRADDQTPPASLRYAVWVGEVGKPLAYDGPPTTVVSAWGDRLSLGHESRCSPANLVLPASLAVGVRIEDLAGNLGTPSEADITVTATASRDSATR